MTERLPGKSILPYDAIRKRLWCIWVAVFVAVLVILIAGVVVAQRIYTRATWDFISGADGYTMHVSTVQGDYTNADTYDVSGDVNEMKFTLMSLKPGREYFMVVTAHNDLMRSGYSNEISMVPPMPAPVIRYD